MTIKFVPVVYASSLQELQKANSVTDGIKMDMVAFVQEDRRYWLCTSADEKGSEWRAGRSNVLPPPIKKPLPTAYQDDPTFMRTGVTVGAQVIDDPICTLAMDGAIVEIDARIVSCQTDILGASYYRRIRKVFRRTLGTVSVFDTIWDEGAGLLGTAALSVISNKPTLRLTGAFLTTAHWTYTVTVCGDGIEMP